MLGTDDSLGHRTREKPSDTSLTRKLNNTLSNNTS